MIDPSVRAQILPHVLTEVKNQVVAPERVVRLRLQLYYRVFREMRFLWSNAEYTIRQAIRAGDIALFEYGGVRWLHLPDADPKVVEQSLSIKGPVFASWTSAVSAKGRKGAGHFGQAVIREGFRAAGFPAFNGAPVLLPDGTTLDVDVPAIVDDGIPVWAEVKNKFSEVYAAPTARAKLNEDYRQIDRLFRTAHQFGVTPVLFASLVDRSFYGYQASYRGLHFSYLFQYLPPEYQRTCGQIREHFRIGHVATLSLDAATGQPIPPTHVVGLVKSIPLRVRRRYGV